VLEALLAASFDVTCVDSFRHNGTSDRIAAVLEDGVSSRVEVVVHDLVMPFSRRQLALLDDVTDVVHVASRCQVEESIQEPDDFILNNVAGTVRTLELARELNAHVIQMSTDEVFGERGGPTHAPSSPYAASKAAQEDICYAYRETYGLRLQVVNSGNLFGERQSQLAFIPKIIRAAVRSGHLWIHTIDGQPGARRYTYVRNVADYIVAMLLKDELEDEPRHHLPGQEEIDNITLVRRVGELVGSTPSYELVEADFVRPGYDRSYAAMPDNPRWRPTHSVEAGLERTVAWAMRHPEWLET